MAGVVLLVALSGLGCQNKSCDASVVPVGCCACGQSIAHVHAGSVAPIGYPASSASHYGNDHYAGYDLQSSIRSTLWSFVLGHDPDGVPTVAEIEADLASDAYRAAAIPYPSAH
jgi:hypothetical protein